MSTPIDLTALKNRQMASWASGDYAVIGTTLQLVGELLAEACDLRCDERVLDAAASLNQAGPGSLVVPSEYLEVVITRS